MVKHNFWIDAKRRDQTPTQRDAWTTGTVTEQVGDGMLAVAIDGTPEEWPDVVAPADPGVFALGASVRLLRDSTGRVVQVAAPNELPEGAETFPVCSTGQFVERLKAEQGELDESMTDLAEETAQAASDAQQAANDATTALLAANSAVRQVLTEFAKAVEGEAPPETGWSETIPATGEGEVVWQRTRVVRADGTESVTPAFLMASGGGSGTDGRGVASVESFWCRLDDGVTPEAPVVSPPPAPWQDTEPVWTDGTVLWRVEIIEYTDGSFGATSLTQVSSDIAASHAVQVANLAEQAAADLIRASQTDPGHAPGRIWIILDAQGNTVGIKQSVDGVWTSYALMADQLIVPGSVDNVLIRNGAVDASKITASDELWAKIATFAKVTTEQLIAGGATITGTMLADIIQLSSRLVAGDPSGDRTELDATGLHVWRGGVERARLSASGNGLQIYNPSMGEMVELAASAFGTTIVEYPQRLDIPVPRTASGALEWKPGEWVIKTVDRWVATTDRAQGLSSVSLGDSAVARDFGVRSLFRLRNTRTGEFQDFTDSGNDWGSAIRSSGPNLSFNIVPVIPGDTYDVVMQAQAIKYVSAQGKPWVKNTRIVLTPV